MTTNDTSVNITSGTSTEQEIISESTSIPVYEKEIAMDESVEKAISGPVDFVKQIDTNEILFAFYEEDDKDHLYIYNTKAKTKKDLNKTVNGKLFYSSGVLTETKKAGMSGSISVKRYNESFNVVGESSYSDEAVLMYKYAVSDDGEKIATVNKDAIIITDLETKDSQSLQFKSENALETVISLGDDTMILSCKSNENRLFCLVDYELNVLKAVSFDFEKTVSNDYNSFILICEKSEPVPTKTGEATIMDKRTGEVKTVKFTQQKGEGQSVKASDNGKYIMTQSIDRASEDSRNPEYIYRVYETQSNRIVHEFKESFADYGSVTIYIDDINDKLFVFKYDLESDKKDVLITDLGEKND